MEYMGHVKPQHLVGTPMEQDTKRPSQPLGRCYPFPKEVDVQAALNPAVQGLLKNEHLAKESVRHEGSQGSREENLLSTKRTPGGTMGPYHYYYYTKEEAHRQSVTKGEGVYQRTMFTIPYGCIYFMWNCIEYIVMFILREGECMGIIDSKYLVN